MCGFAGRSARYRTGHVRTCTSARGAARLESRTGLLQHRQMLQTRQCGPFTLSRSEKTAFPGRSSSGGARSTETMFSQESPFNLAQTTTDDVAASLEDGLERLILRTYISKLTNSDGIPRPVNAKYHFDFNHEQGSYVENDYHELITKYLELVNNLKRVQSDGPCVYVHYTEVMEILTD